MFGARLSGVDFVIGIVDLHVVGQGDLGPVLTARVVWKHDLHLDTDHS